MRSPVSLVISLLVVLSSLSPVPIQSWELDDDHLRQVYTDFIIEPHIPVTERDLDADGTLETIVISSGHAVIRRENAILWESPESWKVKEAQITDLNRDSSPEVTLLVWRPFKPWPIDRYIPHGGRIEDFQTSNGMSSHLILIGWKDGQVRELWAGSALAEPLRGFGVGDLDGDGFQELAARETSYTHPDRGTAISIWKWNGFGFTLGTRLVTAFNRFQVEHSSSITDMLLVGP